MSRELNLLIVDDEPSVVKFFERLARQDKLSYSIADKGEKAIETLRKTQVDLVLLDIHLPEMNGFQVLEYVKNHLPETEVVVITGRAKVEDAVRALKMGAFDYLTKPFEQIDAISSCIKEAIGKVELKRKMKSFDPEKLVRESFEGLIGSAKPMLEVYQTIDHLSESNASVLILGESGTGKELLARAIYKTSPRKTKPFVVINCSAIPETLMESELFGHVKGAFTGATQDKRGLFEEADGGTVFLDEIGEIPLSIQVKLLRILQEKEIRLVGGSDTRRVDVRVIAATHRNLHEMIKKGEFREDLYYRLNVISVHLPALRERSGDIPLLAHFFLRRFADKMKKPVKEISFEAMQMLQNYTWVGNVRELENAIERSVVLSQGASIETKDLPSKLVSKNYYLPDPAEVKISQSTYQAAKERAISLFNKNYLRHLLQETHGNISIASVKAGMDRSNLKKILRKYEIDLKEFRRNAS